MPPPANIILTHRYGDLAMLLPLAKHWADQGRLVRWVVHPKFKDMLEGVSYVTPELWDGDCNDAGLEDSIQRASILKWDGQLYIPRDKANRNRWQRCHHLSADFWLNCDALELYHDLPLVFDRRNREREETLFAKHFPKGTDKPILVYNLEGYSFQYRGGPIVENALIQMNYQNGEPYALCNLVHHRAEKIFDLLGLIERASVMVTVDTVTLHLAHATETPTLAIIPELEHASPEPRFHWIEILKDHESTSPTGLTLLKECLFNATDAQRRASCGRFVRSPEEMLVNARLNYWKRA